MRPGLQDTRSIDFPGARCPAAWRLAAIGVS